MTFPRIVLLETRDPLSGPSEPHTQASGLSSEPARDPTIGPVTGGGLVGVVDPRRGLRSVWRDARESLAKLEILHDGAPLPHGTGARPHSGTWTRRIRLGAEGILQERGLFPDVTAAPVIEWTLRSSVGPINLTFRAEGSAGTGNETTLSLQPDRPTATALLLPDSDESRIRSLLRPLAAREMQRMRRSDPGPGNGLRVLLNGATRDDVEAAVRLVDDAALHDPNRSTTGGRAEGSRFLAGLRDGVPRLLDAGGLVELGLAALVSGRRPLALDVLGSLMETPDPPKLPSLFFLGRYALWTGDPHALAPFSARIQLLIENLWQERVPAAFLPGSRALEVLSEALEPLGAVEWVSRIGAAASKLRAGPKPSRRSLPVLGAAPLGREAESEPDDTGDDEPVLPSPHTFAHPDAAGLGARRTLHSARLLRSWVEGTLGARPDGAYGRLRLAPELAPRWNTLRVEGLQVADATVEVGYRRLGTEHTFSLRQTTGRVPLNLVFEPRLPIRGIASVRIEGDAAEMEDSGDRGFSSIRCQFPLDPDREVIIVAAAGAGEPEGPLDHE
ncbi:MAG: hypothetical protein WD013_04060 [Gemmatimonadota bacterium]